MMNLKKGKAGQGSLEYLIIIAAVLAIAAIVVLFLTGAFTGATSSGDLSLCKYAASKCATELATSASDTCGGSICLACKDAFDVVGDVEECKILDGAVLREFNDAEEACRYGRPDCIISA